MKTARRRIRRSDRRLINRAAWHLYRADFLWGRHSMLKAFDKAAERGVAALDFVRSWGFYHGKQ